MLTLNEQKVVVSTLTKRRAWLKNSLQDNSLDKAVRNEYIEMLQLLDSALKKLAAQPNIAAPSAPKPTPQKPAPKAKIREPKKITLANARILIAEDNKDSACLLTELVQDMGFRFVVLAEDGIAAFDKIKGAEEPFDLILCDWDMPGLTGLEVHNKAKASNTLKDAYFMMVTAVSEAARIKQAIQQGVNDYIIKPVDVEILESKIKAALKLEEETKLDEQQ